MIKRLICFIWGHSWEYTSFLGVINNRYCKRCGDIEEIKKKIL
jgi:hypothetical protein